MKQFSFILNILLVAAVSVLFYLHFSGNRQRVSPGNTVKSSAEPPAKDSCAIGHLVAFVELDSLYDRVDYIRQKQRELENEQDVLGKQYQNAYADLEAQKNNFLKKGNAITQQEAEEFQNKLYQQQQQIESNKQNQAQGIAAKRAKAMEEIQSNLKQFLKDYNSDRRFSYIFATGTGLDYILYKDSTHNITPDVINGLNERFSKKK